MSDFVWTNVHIAQDKTVRVNQATASSAHLGCLAAALARFTGTNVALQGRRSEVHIVGHMNPG